MVSRIAVACSSLSLDVPLPGPLPVDLGQAVQELSMWRKSCNVVGIPAVRALTFGSKAR